MIERMTLEELEEKELEVNKELKDIREELKKRKEDIFKRDAQDLISYIEYLKKEYPGCSCLLNEFNEFGDQIDLMEMDLEIGNCFL